MIPSERRWFSCNFQKIKQKEFEIVKILSKEYSVKSLCEVMNIFRSGYYKWLKTKEMYIDFNQEDYETVEDYIIAIIYDHNYLRPSYVLKYKTPIEYRTQLGFD